METTLSPVQFTANAETEILRLKQAPDFDNNKKLRVGVKGGGCSGMTYILDFDFMQENDVLHHVGQVDYIMNRSHELYLAGMEVNWEGGLNSRGFVFNNPNASSTCGCGTSFAV